MPIWAYPLALTSVLAWAAVLVIAPRRLAMELGQSPSSGRIQAAGFAGLAAAGVALLLLSAGDLPTRTALALAGICALALAYFDARHLIIPDLYSVALAVLGLVGPLQHGLQFALFGAVVGGGLLWVLRVVWRRLAGLEGLGFGDVKLAAALGALLGPEQVLRAICAAAILGLALGVVLHRRKSSPETIPLVPLGVTLSLAGVGLLYWDHLR